MERRPTHANLKRRIDRTVDAAELAGWRDRVAYGGNPEHKRNPGDYGLTPPASPRPDKSLCDDVSVFRRVDALALLRRGIDAGLVSERRVGELPQNIWSVADDGTPLEAQLENREAATYHGYPLPESDPFHRVVLEAWQARDEHS